MADFNWDAGSTLAGVHAPLKVGGRDSSTGDFLMLREISQQRRRFKRFIQRLPREFCLNCFSIFKLQPLSLSILFCNFIFIFYFVAGRVHSDGTSWGFEPEFTDSMTNVTVATGRDAVLSCSVTNLGGHKVKRI